MPRNQRITLLALAAVVVVVAVVIAIASSGGDDTPTTTSAASATTPAPASTTPGEAETTGGAAATQTTPAAPKRPTIVVRDGKPVGGVQKLEFQKGGTIDFAVRSDTPGEIHFHGYDVHRDVPAGGGTVRFRLPAKIDGRFEVEVEETGEQIAQIEVQL
jgi:hypothetical protein